MSDQETPTQESLFGSDSAAIQPLPPAAAAASAKKSGARASTPRGAQSKAAAEEAADSAVVGAERMFTIILEESDEIPPTGQFVGVNGRTWMIRPGEEVTVPACVLEALNDARASVPRTDAAGNIVDYRDKQRLPYRLVRAH